MSKFDSKETLFKTYPPLVPPGPGRIVVIHTVKIPSTAWKVSGRSDPKSRRDNSHPGREGPGRISLQKMTGLGFTTAIDIAFSSLLHQREEERPFYRLETVQCKAPKEARGIKIVKGFKILKISAAQRVVKQSLPSKQKFLTHFTRHTLHILQSTLHILQDALHKVGCFQPFKKNLCMVAGAVAADLAQCQEEGQQYRRSVKKHPGREETAIYY